MTIEEKKDWLNRYRDSIKRADEIAKDIADISYIKGLAVEPLSIQHTHTRRRDLANDVIKLDDLKREYIRACTRSIQIYREILDAIGYGRLNGTVEKLQESEVLFLRYLKLYRFEKIALEMDYTVETVYRIQRRALNHLVIDSNLILKNPTAENEV